jgi:hypothetical protein
MKILNLELFYQVMIPCDKFKIYLERKFYYSYAITNLNVIIFYKSLCFILNC